MTRLRHTLAALAATTVLALQQAAPASAATTLETVRQRGHVICGASQGTVGFGAPDANGEWKGLDIDTCRSIAAAVFGDASKVEFVPLSGQQRISALQTGEIDVLPRTLTWTLRRDGNGINFTFPNYYEFTGFMVSKELGVTRVEDMSGASVCVQTGSTTEVVVNDVSTKFALDLKPVVFDNVAATRQAFFSGRCDALITDAAALASVRAAQTSNPDDFVIFPATGYMDALTPAVRHGDDQWLDIVKWSIQAPLAAELYGVTSANVDEMLVSIDPNVKRFLGVDPGNGSALGLDERFAYNIVKAVGNYAEIFDRNLGKDSAIKIERGANRLFKDGGLMFPMAFQ